VSGFSRTGAVSSPQLLDDLVDLPGPVDQA
jgi:hypothetical protein